MSSMYHKHLHALVSQDIIFQRNQRTADNRSVQSDLMYRTNIKNLEHSCMRTIFIIVYERR